MTKLTGACIGAAEKSPSYRCRETHVGGLFALGGVHKEQPVHMKRVLPIHPSHLSAVDLGL